VVLPAPIVHYLEDAFRARQRGLNRIVHIGELAQKLEKPLRVSKKTAILPMVARPLSVK